MFVFAHLGGCRIGSLFDELNLPLTGQEFEIFGRLKMMPSLLYMWLLQNNDRKVA